MKLPLSISKMRFLRGGNGPRPERDWIALLSILGVAFLISVAWNAVFFLHLMDDSGSPGDVSLAPAHEPEALAEVRRRAEDRALAEARYRTEYRFVDPSR